MVIDSTINDKKTEKIGGPEETSPSLTFFVCKTNLLQIIKAKK
jgi:hypothetical protein